MEFDLDKALEEVPIHIEDPPFPCIRQDKRSSGFISELPSEEGKKLEHFTKLRPKRNKKQQPTQAAVGGRRGPFARSALPSQGKLPKCSAHHKSLSWKRLDLVTYDTHARGPKLVTSKSGEEYAVKFPTSEHSWMSLGKSGAWVK
jgi:hypothetical protein